MYSLTTFFWQRAARRERLSIIQIKGSHAIVIKNDYFMTELPGNVEEPSSLISSNEQLVF